MSVVLLPILQAMYLVLNIYLLALLIRILYSWVDKNPYDRSHPAKALLFNMTDPILEPLRRIIPPLGMIDISPIFAFIALQVLIDVVASLIDGLNGSLPF